MKVVVHHFQCGMSEYFFKRKYIPAVEQIVNSECVAAQVLDKSTGEEPGTAPIISSPSPIKERGEEKVREAQAPLKRPAFGSGG